jgi:multidrug resistance efflux pump
VKRGVESFLAQGLAVVAGGVLLALGGCGSASKTQEEGPTISLEPRIIQEVFRYHGRLKPTQRIQIRSPFDSTLLSWEEHGRRVEKGQVVARVDATPHEQELLVLDAERVKSQGELEEANFNLEATRASQIEEIRKARMRLARAEVSYQSLVRGRDWVGILRMTREQEVDQKKLARLKREVKLQAPQVEKGFVSQQEIDNLHGEIRQLELGIRRRSLDLELLQKGPEADRVADKALEVAKAKAQVKKAQDRAKAQERLAAGPEKRALEAIEEIDKQIKKRREEIAKCQIMAPQAGVFQRAQGGFFTSERLDVGMRAWSFAPIGWITTGGECQIEFWVPEAHLPLLHPEKELTFQVVADQRQSYPARLLSVAQVASLKAEDPRKVRWLAVRASILLPPEQYGPIKPGLNVIVVLAEETKEKVPSLPARTLTGESVTLAGGELRSLEIGRVGLEYLEVRGGLLPGEAVRLLRLDGAEGSTRVAAVKRGDLVETYEESGVLSADSQQVLYANEVRDWRTKINWMAPEGSEVTTGAVCVKFDPGDFANEISSLEDEVAQLQASLDKVEVESQATVNALTETIRVDEARLDWVRSKRKVIMAGSSPEEKAKAQAKLAELEVDAKGLAKKLEVTRKMAGKGFAGSQEVEELEERTLQAKARVEVAALELELVNQGAATSERELARLEEEDVAAQLAFTRAELERGRRRREITLATANASLAAKQQDLKRRKYQLAGYHLRAGRGGVVVYRTHSENGEKIKFKSGSFARRSEGVVAVADLSRSRIEGLVSEEVAWRVKPGQEARFWLPSFPEERYQAEVVHLGGAPQEIPDGAGEQGFEVSLKVLKRSARLQPGMRVRFEIVLEKLPDQLQVPLVALRSEQGKTLVTMQDGQVRGIKIGGRDREFAAVLEGLREGEKVRVP